MKFFNLDALDDQNLNHEDESYYELQNDHPRGWSYICLNETINYYIDYNKQNLIDEE